MSTTAIILDILTAAALIAFTVAGAHRGFFRTVAGLLAVILALVGAQLFTNWAAPHVSGVLQPAIERRVEKKVDAALGGGSSVITPMARRRLWIWLSSSAVFWSWVSLSGREAPI